MTEIEEIPVEFAGLILEEQLLDHLATPEGALTIWQSRLTPEVLPDDEQLVRDALEFVLGYMDEYREPPNVSVLSEEIGVDQFNVPIAPIEYVMEKLRERYKKRQVTKVVRESGKKIAKGSDPDATIAYGIEELTRLKMESSNKKGVATSDDLGRAIDEYHRRAEADGALGITYGYDKIDAHLGGHKVGEVNILLARPKRYKSWQLLKSGVEALRNGANPAFATLELSEDEMLRRFLCMVTNSSWSKFLSNTLRQKDLEYMTEVEHEMQEMPNKMKFFRPMPGQRNVAHLVAEAREHGADILYIDQLSWMDGARDERAWQKIGEIMEQLKDAAQEIPIYMAAQYNREAQGVDGIADIAKIGLSDMVGQTADNLLAIYASADAMKSEPRIIQLGVVESRSYEPKAWEIKVELSEHSDFRCLQEIHD